MSHPTPPADAMVDALLGFLRCLGVEDGNAVYVSAPITTGRDFATWYPAQADQGTPAYWARLRKEIIAPNLERARPLVRRCRARWADRPVVDPTMLADIAGWHQPDYHRFWTRLVEQHAGTVVFSEGWQFSTGCALEFVAAQRVGAELLEHTLAPLSVEDGERLLHDAIAALDAAGCDSSALGAAARELSPAPAGGAVR
ncbi:hypothetical protein LY71_1219 [Geodermatophilus tzadiensis]|uniref:Uncharacterized protein n=1 Tax=Geodermatophilus tzadiensis TaxID=1137988 RepID=A0A2T0T0Z3_9ACTN|nr:hypothetical protein LY71_1219 [Geodermatophilus tzadiensis]